VSKPGTSARRLQSTHSPTVGGETMTAHDDHGEEVGSALAEEHFKPTGTLFVLALFVATIVLLWASVYIILLSRGVTL
jgi:hypothetical protein